MKCKDGNSEAVIAQLLTPLAGWRGEEWMRAAERKWTGVMASAVDAVGDDVPENVSQSLDVALRGSMVLS